MSKIVLASGSPRRRELLASAGVELEIIVSDIDETRLDAESPVAYAERLAREKAQAVQTRVGAGRTIVAADTIVVAPDGAVLGKPSDAADAKAMLLALSGQTHRVVTAFCVIKNGQPIVRNVTTQVTFRALSEAEMADYLATDDWRDKAGGYGIQGVAGKFATEVTGSYSNVVGLPLDEVLEVLR